MKSFNLDKELQCNVTHKVDPKLHFFVIVTGSVCFSRHLLLQIEYPSSVCCSWSLKKTSLYCSCSNFSWQYINYTFQHNLCYAIIYLLYITRPKEGVAFCRSCTKTNRNANKYLYSDQIRIFFWLSAYWREKFYTGKNKILQSIFYFSRDYFS